MKTTDSPPIIEKQTNILKRGLFLSIALVFVSSICFAKPDISKIPQFSGDLPPGTIAWAFSHQLHPLQPETGKLEEKIKTEGFEKDFVKDHEFKFSKELFAKLFEKGIAPIIISKAPKSDPRSQAPETESLGYILDRTHTSGALSQLYQDLFGSQGLSEVIYDQKGRPMNIILVRVVENFTGAKAPSEIEFEKYMLTHKHCYLKKFVLNPDGSTEIQDISFSELPRTPELTNDNPFRSFVWVLQQENIIKKSGVDFDEFKVAEMLVNEGVVRWPELMHELKSKTYQNAIKKAKDFFKSELGRHLLGPTRSLQDLSCRDLF